MATAKSEAPSVSWADSRARSGTLRIPAWAGFKRKRTAYASRRGRGAEPASVPIELLGDAPTCEAQQRALELLLRDTAVYRAVLQGVFVAYQAERRPDEDDWQGNGLPWLDHAWDLHRSIEPKTITVLDVERDALAYTSFRFACDWGYAVDLGVVAHGTRIVAFGHGAAFDRGVAQRDAAATHPSSILRNPVPPSPDVAAPTEPSAKPRATKPSPRAPSKKKAPPPSARLEKGGSKGMFVSLKVQGAGLHVRSGKRGTDGKEKIVSFPDETSAVAAFDERRSALLADGHSDVTWLQDPGATSRRGVSVANPELEAALTIDPTSADVYRVYADWLAERADARAELILAGLALEHDPDDMRAERAVKALLTKFQTELYGPLADYKIITTLEGDNFAGFKWRNGFIRAARFWSDPDDPPLAELVAMLFEHPSGHLVEHLTLGGAGAYGDVLDLIARRAPKSLRSLHLGESGTGPGDIHRALGMPGLRKLIAANVPLAIEGNVRSSQIEDLVIEAPVLSDEFREAFAAIRWPELRSLSVPGCLGAGIDPILEDAAAPSLRRLAVERRLLPRVASASFRTSLDELVLRHNYLTDPDVSADTRRALAAFKRIVICSGPGRPVANVVYEASEPWDPFA